jgi:hypothetical protein
LQQAGRSRLLPQSTGVRSAVLARLMKIEKIRVSRTYYNSLYENLARENCCHQPANRLSSRIFEAAAPRLLPPPGPTMVQWLACALALAHVAGGTEVPPSPTVVAENTTAAAAAAAAANEPDLHTRGEQYAQLVHIMSTMDSLDLLRMGQVFFMNKVSELLMPEDIHDYFGFHSSYWEKEQYTVHPVALAMLSTGPVVPQATFSPLFESRLREFGAVVVPKYLSPAFCKELDEKIHQEIVECVRAGGWVGGRAGVRVCVWCGARAQQQCQKAPTRAKRGQRALLQVPNVRLGPNYGARVQA